MTTVCSSSTFFQNGSSFAFASSLPLTLAPTMKPRRSSVFTAYSSCSTARSGCCSDTFPKPTNRSRCAATSSAIFSFCIFTMRAASPGSVKYRNWLGCTLMTCTSMPCRSISRNRRSIVAGSIAIGLAPRLAMARSTCGRSLTSGHASLTNTCACMSIVRTRWPPTTTWRRAGAGACAAATSARAGDNPQGQNIRPPPAAAVRRKARRLNGMRRILSFHSGRDALHDAQRAARRDDARQPEAGALEERRELLLRALLAGHDHHHLDVEQLAPVRRLGRRHDGVGDEDAAARVHRLAALREQPHAMIVVPVVEDVLEHVRITAGRHRVEHVAAGERAPRADPS